MQEDEIIQELYSKYAKPVRLYVLSLCHNPDLADDVTADTFVKAIKNIDHFQGNNILTWLCTIAKNTYYDYLRKKERKDISFDDEINKNIESITTDSQFESKPMMSPLDSLIKNEDEISLYKVMQCLNSESREVVYLKMFTNLTFKEIGDILGKSENWTRTVFYRSKLKMKGRLENEK